MRSYQTPDSSNVGLNRYGNTPLSLAEMAAAYQQLDRAEQLRQAASEPDPATFGAFPGKAEITPPRLS
jgi:hypothetical protein